MSDPAAELAFQNEIIAHLTAHGWLLGSAAASPLRPTLPLFSHCE